MNKVEAVLFPVLTGAFASGSVLIGMDGPLMALSLAAILVVPLAFVFAYDYVWGQQQ